MLKKTFCWLYDQWLSKAVNKRSDPLVRLIDAISGSECKYCLGVRQWFSGLGFGLLLTSYWYVGLGFIVGAYLMTLGEKHWLCDLKGKE